VPNPEIIRRLGLRTLADAPSQNSWPFLLAMGALTLVGVALLPFAAVEMPHAPGFNLVYVTLVISGDLATAFLLFGQFTASGRPPILILAGAYLLTSLLVLSHLLYFARVMPETGPFPRAPQSAAWMWHFWHLAFPAAALAFAVSERWRGDRVLRRTLTPTLLCVAVVLLATALLNIVATRFAPHLPQLHDGVVWNPITFQLGWTMAGLTAAALAALLTLRDAQRFVHSWLGVALVAFLFDIALNMLALERYNLGWYAGRVSGVIAATFLLAMLIVEINLLYRALAASASRLGEFNARLEARVTEQTSQLTASNTELAGAVRQRDTLLHELNHRVNNNMNNVVSMIQLEGARSDNEETRSVMARLSSRVRAIAMVHHQLFGKPDVTHIDVDVTLRDLARNLGAANAAERRGIVITADIAPVRTHVATAGKLALLMTELVSNALEHGFPEGRSGRIAIRLARTEGGYVLEVADDGIGFDGHVPGYGMHIVRLLTEDLGGRLDLSDKGGACVRMTWKGAALEPIESAAPDRAKTTA
jgi:two-component sensor histidine kinase